MLRVGWERNLSGSEASYTDGSSYVSKLFFPPVIMRFVEVESCRELFAALNGGVFFPPESLNGPDQFQLCCSWVDPSYFSRCGGWEPQSPARPSLPALLYKRKQMDPC